MSDRPTLSLKPSMVPAAAAKLEGEARHLSDLPRVGNPQFQAGSLPSLLKLDGRYSEAGSFKVSAGQKLRIYEPRIKQVYWCQFTDAVNPEFGKLRPVVIVSRKNPLGTHSAVVPISTSEENAFYRGAIKLTKNPNPNSTDDCYAVADHVYTVSHWRLKRFLNEVERKPVIPTVTQADFDRILDVLYGMLPPRKPLDVEKPTS